MRTRTVFSLLLALAPASASVLAVDPDRPTWLGQVSGVTTVDFSTLGLNPGQYTNYSTGAGLTISGLNFTGPVGAGYDLFATNPPAGSPDNFGTGARLRGPLWDLQPVNFFQVSFSPTTAFSLDLASGFPTALTFRVELSTGEVYFPITSGLPAPTFWGIRTDTPFSWVRIYISQRPGDPAALVYQSYGIFDNIATGSTILGGGGPPGGGGEPQGGETPEATTLLYAATGLAVLYLSRRRPGSRMA